MTTATTKLLTSKFAGKCVNCTGPIAVGEQILWAKGYGARHVGDCNTRPQNVEPAAPATVIDLTGVLALFATAKAHLKYPKIRLHDAEATPVVLSVAGDRSRFPGSVNLLGEKDEYGERPFHGRIHTDGTLENRSLNTQAVELLQRFAANPAGVASEYGKLTGNCCFCGAALTDARSTEVGYGPVCADHFGLAWGAKSPNAFAPQLDLVAEAAQAYAVGAA